MLTLCLSARGDDSPEIATGMLHSEPPGPSTSGTTTTSNPWETTPTSNPPNWPQSHPSATSTAYPLDEMEGDREGDLSDSALDQFLASLGDTGENGQAWVWPLFTDSSALELDLAGAGSGGGGGNGNGAAAPSGPSAAPPNNNNSAAGYDTGGAANLFLPNKMVTAAAVLEHLPALYDVSYPDAFRKVLAPRRGRGRSEPIREIWTDLTLSIGSIVSPMSSPFLAPVTTLKSTACSRSCSDHHSSCVP